MYGQRHKKKSGKKKYKCRKNIYITIIDNHEKCKINFKEFKLNFNLKKIKLKKALIMFLFIFACVSEVVFYAADGQMADSSFCSGQLKLRI